MKKILIILMMSLCLNIPIFAQAAQKLPALKAGDTVGIISSGFRILDDMQLQFATERLTALGLNVKVGDAVLAQHGYLAGTDEARAKDINQMFLDPNIKAIFQLRGGFGSARLLSLLDYSAIKKNPKIIMGMSDTTALLLAIHSKTGLITFHGPNASMAWPKFTQNYIKTLLFDAKPITYTNPKITEDDLTQTIDRIQTIHSGSAKGRLLGGNLVVLTSMVGSEYLPDFDGAILFVEDIGEDPYQIDRALTQLKLSGILDKISGFIFGKCTDCEPMNPGSTYGSLRFMEVLNEHIKPLKIPAYYGAMIAHDTRIFTVPIGLEVTMDADKGTFTLSESATE